MAFPFIPPADAAQVRWLDQQLQEFERWPHMGFDCPCEVIELPAIAWGETDKRMAFASVDALWSGHHG